MSYRRNVTKILAPCCGDALATSVAEVQAPPNWRPIKYLFASGLAGCPMAMLGESLPLSKGARLFCFECALMAVHRLSRLLMVGVIARDLIFQLCQIDELIRLPAQLIGNHRRLRLQR